jgi:hypothetical protein
MPFAVAGAVTGIAGGLMQSNAVSSGAGHARAAEQQAAAQQRQDLMPWATSGGLANTASADLLGVNGPNAAAAAMANYQTSPGYQWQLGQGLRAVDAGAAATGMLRSGATLKAEQTFGQGLANSDFGQYYNRLFNLSQLGEKAAAGQGAGSLQAAHDIAATDIAAAGAQSSIYGNMAKGIQTGINQLYSSLNSGGGGSSSSSPYY